MDSNEIEELWKLIEKVIHSHTKKDAKIPLKQLGFKRSLIASNIGNNASYKLSEAISSAGSAAGKVSDKNHHAQRAFMHFDTFKTILKRKAGAKTNSVYT